MKSMVIDTSLSPTPLPSCVTGGRNPLSRPSNDSNAPPPPRPPDGAKRGGDGADVSAPFTGHSVRQLEQEQLCSGYPRQHHAPSAALRTQLVLLGGLRVPHGGVRYYIYMCVLSYII